MESLRGAFGAPDIPVSRSLLHRGCFWIRTSQTDSGALHAQPSLRPLRMCVQGFLGPGPPRAATAENRSWGLPLGAAPGGCPWGPPLGAALGGRPWRLPLAAAPGGCPWGLPLGAAPGCCPWGLPLGAAPGGCPW
eukprot:1143846-Alexandrium_andersonii.AAC.1